MGLNDKFFWDLYDTVGNPEHDLYDSVIGEYNDISGFPIEYWIAKPNFDNLYGEDTNTEWDGPFSTRVTSLPSNEDLIISVFGLSMDDTVEYAMIPKSTLSRDVSAGYVPKAGDVIKYIYNNRNYEIVDVGHEQKVFQGKKLTWEFVLRPYRFSEQSESAQEISYGDTFSSLVSANNMDNEIVNMQVSAGDIPIAGSETILDRGDNETIEKEGDLIQKYDTLEIDSDLFHMFDTYYKK